MDKNGENTEMYENNKLTHLLKVQDQVQQSQSLDQ